jgi:CheY-like chemotaxis protein
MDPSRNAHRLGVLLVDDDPDSVDSLALLVESWGHEARVAYSGGNALHLTQHWRPDACLLDLKMPGMDGLHLARRLRSQPGMANLTLVALTGWTKDSVRNQAVEEGFSARSSHSITCIAFSSLPIRQETANHCFQLAR